MKLSPGKIINKNKLEFRFILVGIWNTVFGYLVFIILETLFSKILSPRYIAYMSAMVLGQIIAVINAFVFHKYYTFRSSTKGKDLLKEFFRFTTTYIFTFVLSLILLPIFVEICNIQPKIAGAIVILILTIVSYLGHSRFSFKQK
ncbi:GtrA family protein [Thermodesulfobacteriota bacterium]